MAPGCIQNAWSSFALTVFKEDDLDKVFSYPTRRFVVIEDRHLGLLRYGLLFGIFVYIFVYQLAYSGGYLAVASPEGQANFRAVQPTINCSLKERADPSITCTDCDPDVFGCFDFFSAASTLPYCEQSGNTTIYKPNTPKRECHFQESQSVVEYESSIMLVSRADEFHQTKVCSASHGPLYPPGGICERVYNTTEVNHYYYGEVENFQVSLVHSVYHLAVDDVAPSGIKSSSAMEGALYVPKDDALCADSTVTAVSSFPYHQKTTNKAPCYILSPRGKGHDIFTLKQLMAAADLTIDSGDPSLRSTGTTLTVSITYSNWINWYAPGETSYVYRVTELKDNYPRADSELYDTYPGTRTVLHRYGILIVAIQSGKLHSWDFSVLLITLTTALGLLAVSTTVTDILACKVLGRRKMYKKCKYAKTVDFSDIKEEDEDTTPLLEGERELARVEAAFEQKLKRINRRIDELKRAVSPTDLGINQEPVTAEEVFKKAEELGGAAIGATLQNDCEN